MKISLESIDLAAGKFTTDKELRNNNIVIKELVTMLTFHLDYENDEIAIIPMIFSCGYTSDDRNQR